MANRYVHPFPARMAPKLALEALTDVRPGGRVLDPMCGSGTVLREALMRGLNAAGRDVDPLAVLMSRVATTSPDRTRTLEVAEAVLQRARNLLRANSLEIPTIDDDPEAVAYVRYWFGPDQERQLRALALALSEQSTPASDILKLALSRMIIRKESGASLARDVSHSRPHRVSASSSFDVLAEFVPSVERIIAAIEILPNAEVSVRLGDARQLDDIVDCSVAAVVTSPPYLNAIDYIRGHRLALIWLGASLRQLRHIRSSSVGAERAPSTDYDVTRIDALLRHCSGAAALPPRLRNMVRRFAGDMDMVLAETTRVLEPGGLAAFVIGNSLIRGVSIDNAAILSAAAWHYGLSLTDRSEREIPASRRYLPTPSSGASPLARRMRTESILVFRAPAS